MKKQIEKRIDKLVTRIAVRSLRYLYRTRKKPITLLTQDQKAVVNVILMPLPIATDTKTEKKREARSGIIYDAAQLARTNPDINMITITDPIPSELSEPEQDDRHDRERLFVIPDRWEVPTC